MRRFPILGGMVILGLCGAALADDASRPPASQPVLVSLSDSKAIDANVGKQVAVEGLVSDAQWSASGRVFFIKFKEGEETQFQGALFVKYRDVMEKAFNGDLSNAFEGARIRIEGKLQIYREHPEILIDDPRQITILVKGPGNSPHARPATHPSASLSGVYSRLTNLTAEQRSQIAAIQKGGHDAELAYEKKLREDQDARIAAILNDDQKRQLKTLQEQASHRDGDSDD